MFYIDAHCDSIAPGQNPPHLDFTRMRVTESGVQFMACFAETLGELDGMLDKLDSCGVPEVRNGGMDMRDWRILRSVEGLGYLRSIPEDLEYLYKRGVRSAGLTWNRENFLSGGASTPGKGLTAQGASALEHMEEMGIAVDLAHISPAGFWDALEVIKKPPMVSHTAADALYHHRRNLTDGQIRAVAERGGVIGVCLYPAFLGSHTIDGVLRHIEHIRNTGGSECTGIGTDFDGIEQLPEGMSGVEDMSKLLSRLDEKTAGLNFARLLRDVL